MFCVNNTDQKETQPPQTEAVQQKKQMLPIVQDKNKPTPIVQDKNKLTIQRRKTVLKQNTKNQWPAQLSQEIPT
jgi:hypothetical protein